jgi:hypothetical protein
VHEHDGSAPGRIRLIDFALFACGQHVHHLIPELCRRTWRAAVRGGSSH